MKILGVIPARYASTRFPGKPLVNIAGKSMVRRVYERSMQSRSLAKVMVATDDERIAGEVRSFGGEYEMTRPDHPSGTDRLLEIAAAHPDYDAYINIQGDEPLIDPRQIDQLGHLLGQYQGAFVGTLIKRLDLSSELHNPNTIKVVRDAKFRALYFSRQAIPHIRLPQTPVEYHQQHGFMKHIGMYGYSGAAIAQIREMARGQLEVAESLEQLRWMEHGLTIYLAETSIETKGVDAPEDVEEVLKLIENQGIE